MSPLVNYATPSVRDGTKHSPAFSITLLCLTLFATFICIAIEILNARAGYYLPRHDIYPGGKGTWRQFLSTESQWRARESRLKGDPTLTVRPLTPAEDAAMRAIIIPGQHNNRLYSWVASVGLLQYPLTIILLCALPITAFHHDSRYWRWALALASILNLLCITLMLYRGYFTSLGW